MAKSITPAWAAGQWVICPGSAQLQALYPEPDGARSEKREEGKAFHHVVAMMLKTFKGDTETGERRTLTSDDVVGTVAPNGVVIDDEMYGAANIYVMDVLKFFNRPGVSMSDLHVEAPVDLSFIRPGEEGFIDAYLHDVKGWEIVVWEGKYGHRYVDPFENWQMIAYVEGIVQTLALSPSDEERITVRFRVVQPRNYHGDGPVSEWVVKLSDLRSRVNYIKMSADEAHGPNPRCIPSPAACADCSGRAACAALQQSTFAAVDIIKEMGFGVPMEGANLAAEINLLEYASDLVKERLSGLIQQAEHQISTGKTVPGYDYPIKQGPLAWTAPPAEVEAFGQLIGVDLVKSREPQLYTPHQAINQKGIDESVISAYAERPPGKRKLTRLKGQAIRKIFTN